MKASIPPDLMCDAVHVVFLGWNDTDANAIMQFARRNHATTEGNNGTIYYIVEKKHLGLILNLTEEELRDRYTTPTSSNPANNTSSK